MTMLQIVKKHSVLAVTVALIAAAAIYPGIGARLYKFASFGLIVLLFLLLGLTLDLSELREASLAVKLHVCSQAFTMLLTPLFFYLTLYRWGCFEYLLGSKPLAVGTMVALCLPTTTNTNVMFTQQAGGDVSATTVNASIGNLIGALITPITSSLALGTGVAAQSLGTTLLSIVEQIIGPLFTGILAQQALRKMYGNNLLLRIRPYGRILSTFILVLFLYLLFCDSFASDAGDGLDGPHVARLIAFCFVIHLIIVAGAWLCSDFCADGNLERRISFLMICPQKTEALGVTLVTSLFDDDDQLGAHTLPIIVYHCVQIFVAASLVSSLKRYVDSQKTAKLISSPSSPAAMIPVDEEEDALSCPPNSLAQPLLFDEEQRPAPAE